MDIVLIFLYHSTIKIFTKLSTNKIIIIIIIIIIERESLIIAAQDNAIRTNVKAKSVGYVLIDINKSSQKKYKNKHDRT